MSVPPSQSAVRKAGRIVRAYQRGEIDDDAYRVSVEIIRAYRDTFGTRQAIIHSELSRIVAGCPFSGHVTSRLKRTVTILNKLQREPKLGITQMHDVAGSRVTVPSLQDLEWLVHTLETRWHDRIIRKYDYVREPRASGYRAIHLVVAVNGRAVEVQLRTRIMHFWAQTVETLSVQVLQNFKQDGEHPTQRALAALASDLSQLEVNPVWSPDRIHEVTRKHLGIHYRIIGLAKGLDDE